MRPTHLPLPRRISTIRFSPDRRQADAKPAADPKPPKKRSLNEAAHKLGN
jgi:hypothetical protein